jgi:glutamine amidotransferase
LLFDHSEEGNIDGLGILPGNVRRFPSGMTDATGARLKVPHMGWNEVIQSIDHPLWAGIAKDARFYFVHSYYVDPADASLTAAWTEYPFRFASAVARDNIFAVQFHPEKSQQAGLSLLLNFVNWDGSS